MGRGRIASRFITGVFLLLQVPSALAITDTAVVPPGVRALIYRSVWATLDGSYDATGKHSGFNFAKRLEASKLAPMVPMVGDLTRRLQSIDAGLAQRLDFGQVDANPTADVQANAFGLAYGLIPGLMIVATVPIMTADIRVNGGYRSTTSMQQTIADLQRRKNGGQRDQEIDALIQVLQQLPSVSGGNIQAALVQQLGYKPVGDWSARGLGDADVFGHYRFIDESYYKQAVRLGMELPTGRENDPDNLVDIPFGKGNAGTYVQTIHDFPLWNETLTFHAQGKFSYQWASRRTFRLFSDADTPFTSEKESLDFQRGHRFSMGNGVSYQVIRGLKLVSEYEYSGQFGSSVSGGKKPGYNYSMLTEDTDWKSHSLTVGVSFSTVPLFMAKKFPLPCLVGLNHSRVLSGTNTEGIDMTYLHVEMYF
jgi:hypothetical protein